MLHLPDVVILYYKNYSPLFFIIKSILSEINTATHFLVATVCKMYLFYSSFKQFCDFKEMCISYRQHLVEACFFL